DIEGAELKALQGASQLLRTHSPIVYVSVHPPFLDEMYGQSKEELLEYMSEMGYTGTLLAIDHEEHWKFVK
ncbi:MAG: FkbM family methyltransferase, partial [bacterium]